jgi:hypothetical protein
MALYLQPCPSAKKSAALKALIVPSIEHPSFPAVRGSFFFWPRAYIYLSIGPSALPAIRAFLFCFRRGDPLATTALASKLVIHFTLQRKAARD